MDPDRLAALVAGWDGGDDALYAALADALRRLVETGELAPGVRLPSERRLADALSVSRGTVVAAYDLLRADDLVRSRQGSGTVVAGAPLRIGGPLGRSGLSTVLAAGIGPDAIDLRVAGWSSADDLPRAAFVDATRALASSPEGHGCWPAGVPVMREAVAARLTAQGLPTEPDQVLITTGAQQAIHLVAQLALRPGDAVAVEAVSYLGALDVFAAAGARTIALPLGRGGPDTSSLRATRPRVLFAMPSFHNPTGVVTDLSTRRRMLRDAADAGVLVVDDQAIVETWFGAPLPPPLASLATDDPTRVLTIGSMSKIVWGGLRVGWVRGARSLIDSLIRLKGLSDLGSSVPSQLVAATLLDDLDALRETRIPEIRRRRDALVDELRTHLPEWRFDVPDGGLALWVDTGRGANAFANLAAGYGVGVLAGSASSADGSHGTHLRLGYGLAPERLVEGVRRLAAAWSASVQAVV
ncbi:MAG TPA: PLP-dependent aminotransferase family protein [Acidimicrobiales bacterium]|nr:PLP-dependent aminotransferase family protein [Acidimicrobiales bacterium]